MPTSWNVAIDLSSNEDVDPEHHLTTAHARLTTSTGMTLEGYGRARRKPEDKEVPEIGEELAAARALRDLADGLLHATSDDLSAIEHHKIHLTS